MDDDQWELSKENIQPIHQGRDVSSMMAGLSQNAQQHLNRQRNEFETELRSYSGPDPLDVWYRYALWVEQSYPTGGKASKLQPLLEKCFTAINSSTEIIDQYKNDPRFLQLWLKYASMYKNPLEVMNVLEVKGLFTELASFYTNYASEMEASGNFKKADLIYQKGLEKAKDSTLLLAEAHKNFQARVFMASLAKKDNSDDEGEEGQQRMALSALKLGKKNQAPVERVEGAVLGCAGTVTLARVTDANVLKEWKNPKEKEGILPFIPEPFNPFVQPYYDKHRVYQGTKEFQFEEIRAVDYFKKQKFGKVTGETTEAHESDAPHLKTREEVDSMKEMLSQQQRMLDQLTPVQEPESATPSADHLPHSVSSPHSGPPRGTAECQHSVSESGNLPPQHAASSQAHNITSKHLGSQTENVTSEHSGSRAENASSEHSGSRAQSVTPENLGSRAESKISSEYSVPGAAQSQQRDYHEGSAGSPQCVDLPQQAPQQAFTHPSASVPLANTSSVNQHKAAQTYVFGDSCLAINKTANASMLGPAADVSLLPHQFLDSSLAPRSAQPRSSTAYRALPDLQLPAADVTGLPDLSELSLMEPIASPGQLKPVPNIIYTEASPEVTDPAAKVAPAAEACTVSPPFPKPAQSKAVKPKIIASDGCRRPESELQKFVASPTINTKEAQRLMREVWSTSLDRSKQELSVLKHVLDDDSILPAPAPPSAPLSDLIYQDESEPPVEKLAVFSLYQDEPSTSAATKKAKGGLSLRPAGLSERPPGLPERPPGLPERPPGLPERPPGLPERPAGLSERPAGLSERPAGLSERPAGLSERPVGLSVQLPDPSMQKDAEAPHPDMAVQDENVLPAGYVQAATARPRVGVLMPVPQPCPDQDDEYMELDDMKPLPPPSPPSCGPPTDLTLRLPSNLADFADHTHIASTPAAWSSNLVPQACVDGDDFTMAFMPGYKRSFRPMPVLAKKESQEPASSGAEVATSSAPLPTQQEAPPQAKGQFSVIMEGSAEHTSVRSGTSCYTLTTTRPNLQTGDGTASQATLDLTRSGYTADRSSASCTSSAATAGVRTAAHSDQHQKSEENTAPAARNSDSTNVAAPEGWRNTSFDPDKLSDRPFFAPPSTVAPPPVASDAAAALTPPAGGGVGDGLPPPAPDVQLPAAFAALSTAGELNPFSEDLHAALLQGLTVPLHERAGFSATDAKMPALKPQATVTLGSDQFHVRRMKGQGAYAKVFQASTVDPMIVTVHPGQEELEEDDKNHMILKVQKPASPWEFYICHELRERLRSAGKSPHVLESVMRVNRGYFFTNGSVLASQYHKHGTLLDLLNGYKTNGLTVTDDIAIYFMIEVLSILENVHSVGIIHADIKPDNFILKDAPALNFSATSPEEMFAECPSSLKLIDFGRSIDMQLLPEGTTFSRKVTTKGFTCCEMQDGRPWTYQSDLCGAAATAHTMLWGSYMSVCKRDGRWGLQGVRFKRYWQQGVWRKVFDSLLNVPSCSELPDLAEMRRSLQTAFFENDNPDLQLQMRQLRSIMAQP